MLTALQNYQRPHLISRSTPRGSSREYLLQVFSRDKIVQAQDNQKDPLASLLFSCAFQKALIKLQLVGGDSARIVAYHDGTNIVGTPEDLLGLLRYINE